MSELKELKQSSRVTGIFTNITDEDIEAAADEPPAPSELDGDTGAGRVPEVPEGDNDDGTGED